MKTNKLRLLSVLTLIGAFASNAEAQITAGDYFIQNVESGRYLNGAYNWGTKASTTDHGQKMTIAESGTGYTINSHYSNGAGRDYLAAGDNTFVDQAAAAHTITSLGDGVYTIKDINGKYLVGEDVDGMHLANFKASTVTDASKWRFLSMDDVRTLMSFATDSNPVDATFFIGDAHLSRNNQDRSAWVTDGFGNGGANYAGSSFFATGLNAEKWGGNSQTFDSYQQISGLPNGKYVLHVQGFYRYNNTTDNTNSIAETAHANDTEVINSYLYANGEEVPLLSIADEFAVSRYGKMPFSQTEAAEAFSRGLYKNSVTVIVEDGTLRIGVKKTTHLGCDWTVWDNFELYYYGTGGDNLDAYKTNLANEVLKAKSVSGVMNKNVASALANAITTYEGKTYTSVDQYKTAISNVKTAVDNARASIASYLEVKKYIDLKATLDAAGQAKYNSQTILANLYTTYNNKTFTELTKSQLADVETAAKLAVSAQGPGANMTYLIANSSFEVGDVTGWTVNKEGDTGAKSASNATYAMEGAVGNYLFNTWNAGGVGYEISQTVKGLNAGRYKVIAIMASDPDKKLVISLNGVKASVNADPAGKGKGVTVSCEAMVSDGSLQISAKTEDGSWFKADEFTLKFIEEVNEDSYRNMIKQKRTEASTLAKSKMSSDALAGLNNAINTTKNYTAIEDFDKLDEYYISLTNACDAAGVSIESYKSAKSCLDKINDIFSKTNVYTADSYTTFNTEKTAFENAYNAGTLTPAAITDYAKSVFGTGAKTENTIDDVLLSAWGKKTSDYSSNFYVNTWSTEADNKTNGSGMTTPFFESWVANAESLGKASMMARINGLTAGGDYKVTALVRVRMKDGAEGNPHGITMRINSGATVDVCAGSTCDDGPQFRYGTFTAYGKATSTGLVAINMVIAAENNINWLSFRDVKCETYDPSAVTTPGDVNNDGVVNIADVAALVKVILNNTTNAAADVNGDNSVNKGDIQTLVDKIIGRLK
ncbi:MAG: dockerin type I repeat-containing protein [Bacteroidaceae bacterium]|nr:dockerin type I repeat-containing protein [Bacteroidaceae bacterium]